jgi:hypothetical protein
MNFRSEVPLIGSPPPLNSLDEASVLKRAKGHQPSCSSQRYGNASRSLLRNWSCSVGTLLLGSVLALAGCTENESKAIDRLTNGPAERQMREKVLASMPANQSKLLESFRSTCTKYDGQPNEIKKSEVFRSSSSIYREVGQIKDWAGIIRSISMGSSTVLDEEIRIGSPVYKAAAGLSENQTVVFSGKSLRDFNLTERGKVCDPAFRFTITAIRKLE